jgi:taurine dioxygenase
MPIGDDMDEEKETLHIERLAQGFGAEIVGVDLQNAVSPSVTAALRDAFDAHHLLVFRNCGQITPVRHIEIASWFGPIGADGMATGRLHNEDAAGRDKLPFHCDLSFMTFPVEGISLHPVALPRNETTTSFVGNASAWDALPSDLQDRLRPLKARHFYRDAATMDLDWPVFETWHPVCLPHQRTGRAMLFVTEHHVDRIEGMSERAGAMLLTEIFDQLYAAERRYDHIWRMGDLLVWDNSAIQHARMSPAPPADGERVLQRVTLGTHSFMEQVEIARQRQEAVRA